MRCHSSLQPTKNRATLQTSASVQRIDRVLARFRQVSPDEADAEQDEGGRQRIHGGLGGIEALGDQDACDEHRQGLEGMQASAMVMGKASWQHPLYAAACEMPNHGYNALLMPLDAAGGAANVATDEPGSLDPGDPTTVLIRAGAPRPGVGAEDERAHYLAVVAGEHAGLRMELAGTSLVIGRAAPADLVIPDSRISRAHCRLSLVLGDVYVTDLGSSNGTVVDGKRIERNALLPPGGRLQIGGHMLEHEFRSRKEVEASKELDRDLESARRYVQSLIPAPLAEGPIRTEWLLLPSTRLGGDVFGYHRLDARTFAIYLIDVSGHGTGAAMHAVSVTNVLRGNAVPGGDMRDPSKVAAYLNTMFQMSSHGGLFMTLWYGTYDLETRTLAYCSAGHHPSYLVPQAGGQPIPLKTRNTIIGAMPAFEYESGSAEVPPGSRLYIFSDGIFEIETKDGQQWGLDDVLPLIVEPQVPGMTEPERLLQVIRRHARSPDFEDDFTVLVATFV